MYSEKIDIKCRLWCNICKNDGASNLVVLFAPECTELNARKSRLTPQKFSFMAATRFICQVGHFPNTAAGVSSNMWVYDQLPDTGYYLNDFWDSEEDGQRLWTKMTEIDKISANFLLRAFWVAA